MTSVPVMSDGIRSGVNCTRRNSRSSVRASVRAMRVLPSPGTPSRSTWPRHRSPMSKCSMISCWPITTFAISFCTRGARHAAERRSPHLRQTVPGGAMA